MSYSPLTNGSPLTGPILFLDNGSRRTAVLLAMPGAEPSAWPKTLLPAEKPVEGALEFLKTSLLPMPELTLVCTMNSPSAGAGARAARMERWREELRRTGGSLELFLRENMPGWEVSPLMAEAKKAFGHTLGADSGAAAALFALSLEKLRERSWQEGVTVLWAGERHIQAFMIYQEKLLGLYEQHTGISREALLADLHELRLNWLPEEKVRAEGGHGCICGDFPAEAEGFRPTWILGPQSLSLQGAGRLFVPEEEGFERCLGLCFGLSRRQGA